MWTTYLEVLTKKKKKKKKIHENGFYFNGLFGTVKNVHGFYCSCLFETV